MGGLGVLDKYFSYFSMKTYLDASQRALLTATHMYVFVGKKEKYQYFLVEKVLYMKLCNLNLFVCVEVLRPSQPNGVMSRTVSLPNHTFTGQA